MPVESTNSCGGYVCSKAGFWKLAVIICGCATFALYASSELYRSPEIKKFVLGAYIISWGISLLIYFSKLTGLSLYMNTSCWSFDSFDYFWSWVSCLNYLSCSVILGCYFLCTLNCRNGSFCPCAQQLAGLLVGVLTAVVYVLEAQNLRLYAPIGTAYGTSWRGIWRMFILVVGGTAFGLLVQTGYVCNRNAKNGCTPARTFVLAVWCTAWTMSCLLYFLHICGITVKASVNGQHRFSTFEFFWSAFSCLLYLVGASVYAGFLECTRFNVFPCRERLASDICGFVAAVLFGIDAYQLRSHRPVWFIRSTAPSSGGGNRVVVTRTTESRTVR